MSQDQIDRDRLLERLDANVTFLVDSHKATTQALVEHTKVDDTRFLSINKDLEDLKKFKWREYGFIGGGLAVLELALKLFKL